MPEPLDGFTVIEMTVAVQGPSAALYLRDMGATVIKVEPPIGDASRYGRGRGNETPPGTVGAQFVAANRGKRSVCIDAGSEAGRRAVMALLDKADVFLSNYREAALQRMGLSWDRLEGKFPNLIHATVNGFGPTGADAEKAMLDGAAVARGGLASVTGRPDEAPTLPGAVVGDTAGAMQLALGVMTALLARERHGGGQRVQTSALGTQLWLQQWELTHTAMTGHTLTRDHSHHPNIRGPYGAYRTRCGGAILLATAMQQDAWDAFCVFADLPELAVDARLASPGQRLGEGLTDADSDEFRAKLEHAFAQKTALEWDDFLRSEPEIIWERVRDYAEVLEDEQSIVNGYITEVDIPGLGSRKTVGNLVTLSATPGSPKGNPPELGEGTREILAAAGVNQDEIDAIEQQATAVREAAFAALAGSTIDD